MEPDTCEITKIEFGVSSPEDILRMSCCEVTNPKASEPGGLYDYRMGTTDEKKCETCGQSAKICPGHFGHIELNERIIHPLYYKEVVNYLRCICTECHKPLITQDEIDLHGLNRYIRDHRGLKRFWRD